MSVQGKKTILLIAILPWNTEPAVHDRSGSYDAAVTIIVYSDGKCDSSRRKPDTSDMDHKQQSAVPFVLIGTALCLYNHMKKQSEKAFDRIRL